MQKSDQFLRPPSGFRPAARDIAGGERGAPIEHRDRKAPRAWPENRHRTLELLCTDERHFRALRAQGGKPFRLLPFDA